MRAKDRLGRYGEQVAARYLTDRGYVVLAANWRCSQGELDLIALDGEVLVFVEVKTRSSTRFGVPAEAVNRVKAGRLRALAGAWLAEHRPQHNGLRFDVISILSSRAGAAQVEHLQAVI